MKNVILADRFDCQKVNDETKYEFTIYVLQALGIPEEMLEDCFAEIFEDFSAKHKINLRELLKKFDIEIIDEDGDMKIYVGNDVVAHWKKSIFKLRQDRSIRQKAKRLYVEIHTEYWTIFDEENDESGTE